MSVARRALDRAMTEADLQQAAVDLARTLGYRCHHCRPAQTRSGRWMTPIQGDPGYPDLTIAGHGLVVVAECKTERGRVTGDQQAWLDALGAAGHVVGRCLRPSGWDDLAWLLTQHARTTP